MKTKYISQKRPVTFSLWQEMIEQRKPIGFELELTARCNNNCRHCYINLPVNDTRAKSKEMPFLEISKYIDEAASLGAMWCLLTGGEPLLREDFFDIYHYLRKKGIFIQIFTNATLIGKRHIALFKKYPPQQIEITVYGITKDTYERVTRTPGSFAAFMRGLDLLQRNNIKVRLKAMIMRSNIHEAKAIQQFCEKRTKDYYRFDPFLQLRLDFDESRNAEIQSERLLPTEIARLELNNTARKKALINYCRGILKPPPAPTSSQEKNKPNLFYCNAGKGSFAINFEGFFRICSTFSHPEYDYSLRTGTIEQAFRDHYNKIISLRSDNVDFLKRCSNCLICFLCQWCPARAYLETRRLDGFTEYFCEVAQARAAALGIKILTKAPV
jgi:radical SAM protein with 4Fe4S-binding SPASM domain